MIDLFAIFSRGGFVLWYFQGTTQLLTAPVNALIRDVFLQERSGINVYKHQNSVMKFKLDNEFELVYLAMYQSIVQLGYVDKFLDDVRIKFRDMYKNELADKQSIYGLCGTKYFDDFDPMFKKILQEAQELDKIVQPKVMRNFQESVKSQKTIASMLIQPNNSGKKCQSKQDQQFPKENNKVAAKKIEEQEEATKFVPKNLETPSQTNKKETATFKSSNSELNGGTNNGTNNNKPVSNDIDDEILRKRAEFIKRQTQQKSKLPTKTTAAANSTTDKPTKKRKEDRRWDNSGTKADEVLLDFSKSSALPKDSNGLNGSGDISTGDKEKLAEESIFFDKNKYMIGKMRGELKGFETDEDEDDVEDIETVEDTKQNSTTTATTKTSSSKAGGMFSVFSAFKSLVGQKKLTMDDIQPALEKMKDHLIAKNVAADIASKLCQSLATKLDGKVIGTFSGVMSTVKSTLRESLVQLLSPKRRVDILRDVMEARAQKRPYSIVFCGVNGVGKSTNLAKITFWLNENNFKVLIAACDTFRAGAVEQLRTHTRHLNALHPGGMVQLYEQGYGKDAAGVAAQAIKFASENGHDVVLVDTAGRMQDNEPLMRALTKLIRVNSPDLVLFVGEALVGNEAVDQLTKFNQALVDNSDVNSQIGRQIDGIVLTKFDTIDDKVGAAVSMAYITGQPIVFVGTGQTYADLKSLNANAVVHALLK